MSILPYELLQKRFSDKKLKETSAVLRTYTGEQVYPVGCLTVQVEYQDQACLLPLYVVQTKRPVLMGRDWLHKLRLDWKTIKSLKLSDHRRETPAIPTQEKLSNLLDKYADIFEDKLGIISQSQNNP